MSSTYNGQFTFSYTSGSPGSFSRTYTNSFGPDASNVVDWGESDYEGILFELNPNGTGALPAVLTYSVFNVDGGDLNSSVSDGIVVTPSPTGENALASSWIFSVANTAENFSCIITWTAFVPF